MTGIVMFVVALVLLLLGFPVAFTFGGVAVLFGVLAQGWDLFALMPFRVYSIMQNTVLMAVPLFIFMGVVLQKTELAEQLLESMGRLFGTLRGGLAVSTILVGALLAASTGVVGASVVAIPTVAVTLAVLEQFHAIDVGDRHSCAIASTIARSSAIIAFGRPTLDREAVRRI